MALIGHFPSSAGATTFVKLVAMIPNLAIIGVGLIGGSLGLAVHKHKVARHVLGIGRNRNTLQIAENLGAIDEFSTDLAAVKQADVVVVCTPVETIPHMIAEISQHVRSGTIITDAGSTKERLVKQVEKQLRPFKGRVEFVGCHPMAGSEKTSVEHALANLFEQRAVIVTPTSKTSEQSLETVVQLWSAIGAHVHFMSPREHDALVASTSHVPHLVAAALAAAASESELSMVAKGWLDTTRIAAGDVELWRQILSQNRQHVLKSLARLEKILHSYRIALELESDTKLVRLLEEGKRKRDSVGS
jgi:prephenate dehydrogenase